MRIGDQVEERSFLGVPSESSDKWESLNRVREHRWISAFVNAPVMRNQNQESQI